MSFFRGRATILPLALFALVLLKLVAAKEKSLRDLVVPVCLAPLFHFDGSGNVLKPCAGDRYTGMCACARA
jgi:hypothetical protein